MRQFFDERGFVEVETPLLAEEVVPELHIEPIAVGDRWLQASPELHMKRLLAEGMPAIYQASRSFRRDERGRLHNPEFTIVEWYRAGDDFVAGMSLLSELIETLISQGAAAPAATLLPSPRWGGAGEGAKNPARSQPSAPPPTVRLTTYAAAFRQYAAIDPHQATASDMAAAAKRLGVSIPSAFPADDRDEWLNLVLAAVVEPRLGSAGPEILCEYPATQAALATTSVNDEGVEVAERFELYWQGVELANGYHELSDAAVLRRRFEEVNRRRNADGRTALPLPERFLAAHEDGLPACSGCALGFDRLVMLACGATTIDEVMAYAWNS